MQNKKLIIIISLVSLVIFILGVAAISSSSPQTLNKNANSHIEFMSEKQHNWGEIDIEGGVVEKEFEIKNTGEGNLEVNNFKTSCMCTEVEVIINGERSPAFGMHSQSGWKGVIKPGESAQIHVVFDPMFHGPQGTGPVTRYISFNTNDQDNSSVELKLTGDVVKK